MKKFKLLGLVVALLAICMAMTACNTRNRIEPKGFVDWVNKEGSWRTASPNAFKNEERLKPSDGDVKKIAKAISMAPSSGGGTDFMCVVLKDRLQQEDVVGMNNANDGTVTLLVFGSNLSPTAEEGSTSGGYYQLGIASGYASLAAISLGYGTHFYMETNYSDPSATFQRSIEDAYLKDRSYRFIGGIDGQSHDAYGNMRFVCAIVVGALDKNEGDIDGAEGNGNVIIADELNAGQLARIRLRKNDVEINDDVDSDIFVGDGDEGNRAEIGDGNDDGDDNRDAVTFPDDGNDNRDGVVPPDDGGSNVGGGVMPPPPDTRRIVVFSATV